MIRDTTLAASGSLSDRSGGPGVRPPLPKEITSTLLRNQWPVSKDETDHRRRSIYLFARRNLRLPMFDLFDRPSQAETCARRQNSTTAPQSLALLNSDFTRKAADHIALHAENHNKTLNEQITICHQLLLGRAPTANELKTCHHFIQDSPSFKQGMTDLCLAMMNLNEFLYLD